MNMHLNVQPFKCVCVYLYVWVHIHMYFYVYSIISTVYIFLTVLLPLSAQSCLNSCTLPLRTAGQLVIHTNTHFNAHTDTLFFPCSASLQSSCIYPRWNWVEQWHDGKGVVWWACWKVESSPRWPLSGGWGRVEGFDGVMDWCHSGQRCSAE